MDLHSRGYRYHLARHRSFLPGVGLSRELAMVDRGGKGVRDRKIGSGQKGRQAHNNERRIAILRRPEEPACRHYLLFHRHPHLRYGVPSHILPQFLPTSFLTLHQSN